MEKIPVSSQLRPVNSRGYSPNSRSRKQESILGSDEEAPSKRVKTEAETGDQRDQNGDNAQTWNSKSASASPVQRSLFTCRVCEKGFSNKNALHGHLKAKGHNMHFGQNIPVVGKPNRPYCCLRCDKCFPSWKALNFHIKALNHAWSRRASWSQPGDNLVHRQHDNDGSSNHESRKVFIDHTRSTAHHRRQSYSPSSLARSRPSSPESRPRETEHKRRVVYRDGSSSSDRSSSRSSATVTEIPLEPVRDFNPTDPRTAIRRRFIPKRIPVTHPKCPEYYINFPKNYALPWKLAPVVRSNSQTKPVNTQSEISTKLSETATEEVKENLFPDIKKSPTIPFESSKMSLGEDHTEKEAVGSKISSSFSIKEEKEAETDFTDDVVTDNFTRDQNGNDGSQNLNLNNNTQSDIAEENDIFLNVEARMAELFCENEPLNTQENLENNQQKDDSSAETICHMYVASEPIDDCPECSYDLNQSPLLIVNLVTKDVTIECIKCGVSTVMEGAFS